MRKLLLLFVTVIISLNVMSQKKETVFEVYQKYVIDCNEIVLDTIIESGTVKMEYKPFKMDGSDCLMLVPIDTAWNESVCKPYKYVKRYGTTFGNLYDGSITLTNYATNTSSTFSYGTTQISQMSENITREKICKIKKRKPSFDDFWNRWCSENGYIE